MKEKKHSVLTVPVDRFYLSVVRSYVREIAQKVGFSEEDVNGIVLATDEAATNVIEHAFLPGEAATYTVACEVSGRGLKVIIRDKGLPFAPEQNCNLYKRSE